MKTKLLSAAILAVLGVTSNTVQAATLSIDTGSFFTMSSSILPPAAPGFDGQFITGFNGLIIDGTTVQLASGSHAGAPDASESPGIDNPWLFFGSTGMHSTNKTISVLTNDGAGNVSLDFSGWEVAWNLVESPGIDMGVGAWSGNPSGVANMTCVPDCSDGHTYALTYSATVPPGLPGLSGTQYALDIHGTISGVLPAAVPVPAAAWLFGSGLIGLVGVARRKKVASC